MSLKVPLTTRKCNRTEYEGKSRSFETNNTQSNAIEKLTYSINKLNHTIDSIAIIEHSCWNLINDISNLDNRARFKGTPSDPPILSPVFFDLDLLSYKLKIQESFGFSHTHATTIPAAAAWSTSTCPTFPTRSSWPSSFSNSTRPSYISTWSSWCYAKHKPILFTPTTYGSWKYPVYPTAFTLGEPKCASYATIITTTSPF
ncbi:hypothetical protein LWI28_023768 [Acer negundo]|uniref:Uncharacterized protein n=1 Tax=Acer negundo TaxID=4023 RepID=A0AAD5NP31_ACENE|nr:hypothetical protein LWI28_023768 [Acer negundo]